MFLIQGKKGLWWYFFKIFVRDVIWLVWKLKTDQNPPKPAKSLIFLVSRCYVFFYFFPPSSEGFRTIPARFEDFNMFLIQGKKGLWWYFFKIFVRDVIWLVWKLKIHPKLANPLKLADFSGFRALIRPQSHHVQIFWENIITNLFFPVLETC